MDKRPGCLTGLFELFLVDKVYKWSQKQFGFGRGGFCGCGCGLILFLIMVGLVCSVLTGTDWSHIGF